MKTVTCECGHEETGTTEKDVMTKNGKSHAERTSRQSGGDEEDVEDGRKDDEGRGTEHVRSVRKKEPALFEAPVPFSCCGGGTCTRDLQVMSLASYYCSTPLSMSGHYTRELPPKQTEHHKEIIQGVFHCPPAYTRHMERRYGNTIEVEYPAVIPWLKIAREKIARRPLPRYRYPNGKNPLASEEAVKTDDTGSG